ncbi:hypothetical protein A0J48_006910 [Sphaerospermopsis aphanizomenoides BCCUSP55]|uniref:hypothetical protein n=1 Tax=Sphaerospermopsis aphanizomenoides TaxID=459663 RepID=UPI001905A4AC|nr:hypothetical protein [Sphaerospermopsis aphanizomenoides]MBK1987266.1 hypothetical protein [Sphaerospermopsis aphanizomenoides BCCUSP55]
MKRFSHNKFPEWRKLVCTFRRQGIPPKEALHRAALHYTKHLIEKGIVPSTMKWNGKPHHYDEDCNCCDLAVKAGILQQPGKLRYLGNFYAGKEKVCTTLYDEAGEPYTDDIEFNNRLMAYRCEVCGNEWTDGY